MDHYVRLPWERPRRLDLRNRRRDWNRCEGLEIRYIKRYGENPRGTLPASLRKQNQDIIRLCFRHHQIRFAIAIQITNSNTLWSVTDGQRRTFRLLKSIFSTKVNRQRIIDVIWNHEIGDAIAV